MAENPFLKLAEPATAKNPFLELAEPVLKNNQPVPSTSKNPFLELAEPVPSTSKNPFLELAEPVPSPMAQAAAEGPQPTDATFTMDSLDTNKAWIDSARKIYQSEKGPIPIEMQRDPAKLAQWLKERHSEIGWSLANVAGKGIVETALTTFDMKDDAKQAWIKSLDMYEKTDSDWGSRARAANK